MRARRWIAALGLLLLLASLALLLAALWPEARLREVLPLETGPLPSPTPTPLSWWAGPEAWL